MKKALVLLVALSMLVAAGCATTGGNTRAKCPSCGYEFDVKTN